MTGRLTFNQMEVLQTLVDGKQPYPGHKASVDALLNKGWVRRVEVEVPTPLCGDKSPPRRIIKFTEEGCTQYFHHRCKGHKETVSRMKEKLEKDLAKARRLAE